MRRNFDVDCFAFTRYGERGGGELRPGGFSG
jgi:hypothetical protein